MTIHRLLLFICVASAQLSFGQVQSPSAYLGYELGQKFTRHHQVISYFQQVDAASDKVILQTYGKTYEDRPLVVALVSSPENLAKLETIRKDNLKRAGLMSGQPETNIPVIWLSYNVHGNESVSTEAAMATLYELVKGGDRSDWLKKAVIVIDPCLNPDGRERYISFYWQHGNFPYNPLPDSWEHHEPWPGGRANHYYFDLNRDWAWQSQKESQHRLALYNQWLPQIHVDFHEQGINSPYYFAPAAEPYHGLITDWQRDFQAAIGKSNAGYFDQENWMYFTRQIFDLVYPSYGDTYPMYNGAIGMTYEQGGSGRAGLGVLMETGDTLTLKDRIDHHYTTGLSTIETTVANADKVMAEFKKFYTERPKSEFKSYVLKAEGNEAKVNDMMKWLDQLGISYGTVSADKPASGYEYVSGSVKPFTAKKGDLVISADQPKSVLVNVLFEPKTHFNDSLTYDITAWSAPYAYGVNAYATTTPMGQEAMTKQNTVAPAVLKNAYAYAFGWKGMKDARLLAYILQKGIKVRYATQPFTADGQNYDRGTIVITKSDNSRMTDLTARLSEAATRFSHPIATISTGLSVSGPDLGSSDFRWLKAPKVALLGGDGVSSLDFGATWHYLEQELGYPVTTLSSDYFGSVNLNDYDVLILQNGWYGSLRESDMKAIDEWVRAGGKLIAVEGALRKLVDSDMSGLKKYANDKEKQKIESIDEIYEKQLMMVPEAARERYQFKNEIIGAIYKVKLDNTHPLAFGYSDTYFTLKNSASRFAYLPKGNVGVIETEADHMSGFVGQLAKEKILQTLVLGSEQHGFGQFIYMVDNPLFRSFWYGGELLFANAIFFE